MKIQRLYLDTSVIGGYFDPEFVKWTRQLFTALEAGRFVAVLSPVVGRELLGAPPHVQELVSNGTFSILCDSTAFARSMP